MYMDNNLCHHKHLSLVRAVPEDIFEKRKGGTRREEIEEKKLEKRDEIGEGLENDAHQ